MFGTYTGTVAVRLPYDIVSVVFPVPVEVTEPPVTVAMDVFAELICI